MSSTKPFHCAPHYAQCFIAVQCPSTHQGMTGKLMTFYAVATTSMHNFTTELSLPYTYHDPSGSGARKTMFLHWPDGHESIYHTVSHQGPGCLMPGHNVLQYLHAHNVVAEGLPCLSRMHNSGLHLIPLWLVQVRARKPQMMLSLIEELLCSMLNNSCV